MDLEDFNGGDTIDQCCLYGHFNYFSCHYDASLDKSNLKTGEKNVFFFFLTVPK